MNPQRSRATPYTHPNRSTTSQIIPTPSSSRGNGVPSYTATTGDLLVIRPVPTRAAPQSNQHGFPAWSTKMPSVKQVGFKTNTAKKTTAPQPQENSPLDLTRHSSASTSTASFSRPQTSTQTHTGTSAIPNTPINRQLANQDIRLLFNGPSTNTAMIAGGGVYISDENRITLHYQSQRPIIPHPLPPPKPLPPAPLRPSCRPSAPVPTASTFGGLGSTVVEGSFSNNLTDKLEENYMKRRLSVMTEFGELVTPFQFLKQLCETAEISVHSEVIRFQNTSALHHQVQFRTEVFAAGFCGVAHALSPGFSSQLAAAHVLERMRVHIPAIQQSMYALYPGNRYTCIGQKLEKLCEQYGLGEIQVEEKNLRKRDEGNGRRGGMRRGDSQVKWEVSCYVQRKVATVFSDNLMFGTCLAKMRAYLDFVKPPQVAVVQIKDYFAVGVDCPMFKDIHPSLYLYKPSIRKLEWMREFKVGHSQMDKELNDPRNSSDYLMTTGVKAKFVELKEKLEEALWRLRGIGARRENNGMGNRRFPENGGGGMGMGRAMQFGRVAGAVDAADEDMDAEDREVEEIFHDARMEVE